MKKSAAYHEWLGIPPQDQPPTHYALLGIPPFERNSTVISNAAHRQINFLQTLFGGSFSELSQEIQKEVAVAKLCLLDRQQRDLYENQLATVLGQSIPSLDSAQDDPSDAGSSPGANGSVSELPSVEIFIEEMQGKSVELSKKLLWIIGSADDCDLVLKNDYVSRKHCLLIKTPDFFELEDLGSTNGTYVNKEKLVPQRRRQVTRSDIITLGRRTLMPWPPIENGSTDRE